MTIKACVFDMDGTLLNTLDDLAGAMNKVLAEHNYATHSVDAYKQFVGSGIRQLIIRALPEHERQHSTIEQCLSAFHAYYNKHWADRTRVYDGLGHALDLLTEAGVKLAILTNKPQAFADLCVSKYLSRWRWTTVQGQQDGLPVKPDVAISQKVTNALGVAPSDVLYFGDSDVDMYTAINAGYHAIGVSWGFRGEEELKAAGAQQIIDQATEIAALIKSHH